MGGRERDDDEVTRGVEAQGQNNENEEGPASLAIYTRRAVKYICGLKRMKDEA